MGCRIQFAARNVPIAGETEFMHPTGLLGLVGFERRLVVEQPALFTVVIELVSRFVREVFAPVVFFEGRTHRPSVPNRVAAMNGVAGVVSVTDDLKPARTLAERLASRAGPARETTSGRQ
jgi:hypothetical protein